MSQTKVSGEDSVITTEPPTFSEYANLACKIMKGKNSDSGTKANCINNPDCLAYLVTGNRGRYCEGAIKVNALVGLDIQKGDQKVFIKSMHQNIT